MNKKLFFIPFLVTVVSNNVQTEDKFNPGACDKIEIVMTSKNGRYDRDTLKELHEPMCNLSTQVNSTDGVKGEVFVSPDGNREDKLKSDEGNERTITSLIQRTDECSMQDWEAIYKKVKNLEETLSNKNFQEENGIITDINFHFLLGDEEAQK